MFDIDTFTLNTDVYDLFEGMTSISAVIKSVSEGTSDRDIICVLFDSSRADKISRELSFLSKKSIEMGFDLVATPSNKIASLTSGDSHGGIVLISTKRSFGKIDDAFVNNLTNNSFYTLIDGVEDPYNFAYSIRSLYASGVDGIILPHRNWMSFSGTVARSSAGTSELVDIRVADTVEAAQLFKNHGFKVVCASIRDSVSIYEYDFSEPILLVVGGEKRGISRKILDISDANVRIEYGREFMGSLPSASAVSVIAFEIARQKKLFKK